MNGPLQEIRVVDESPLWVVSGCAMDLAGQGADAIKEEPPRGDQARAAFTLPAVTGESRAFRASAYAVMNRRETAKPEFVLT